MTTFILKDTAVRMNCLNFIKSIPDWKIMEVTVGEPKKSRQQERYVHMLWGIIAKHTGDDPETVKDRVKLSCLPKRLVAHGGKTYELPASTAALSKEEYTRLIDATLMVFDLLGLTAPAPGYYGYDFKRGSKMDEVA